MMAAAVAMELHNKRGVNKWGRRREQGETAANKKWSSARRS